ncbi:MAG: diguanylate cyclase, partial [Candidatus Binatia bacterium]|nr:diguanylate cyclase [Candidatus Binatia bacterium]
FPHPSGSVRVTMSFGVTALVRAHPQSLRELIEEADKALYAAKQQGRDRVERYTRPD